MIAFAVAMSVGKTVAVCAKDMWFNLDTRSIGSDKHFLAIVSKTLYGGRSCVSEATGAW